MPVEAHQTALFCYWCMKSQNETFIYYSPINVSRYPRPYLFTNL